MGFELEWIDINHDLPIFAAERLGNRSAGDVRHLVANRVLAMIAELRLAHSFTLQSNEADRQARSIELQNNRRKSSGREVAQNGRAAGGGGGERSGVAGV